MKLSVLIGVGSLALLMAVPVHADKIRANVTVKNSSSWSLYRLYMSPSSQTDWGPDQLGDKIVHTGGNFVLESVPCDTYDVKIVDEDGDECVINRVDICGASETWEIDDASLLACQAETAGAALPSSTGTTISVTNQSAWTIHLLYLSPVSSTEWGPDQLGTSVIPSNGGTFRISNVLCGAYDVKIVDEDGDACIIKNTDICGGSNSSWLITSENLLSCQSQQ